jgi:hypothetical protein
MNVNKPCLQNYYVIAHEDDLKCPDVDNNEQVFQGNAKTIRKLSQQN